MSENYRDIASLSWDNIPKVKTLPDGSYKLRGRNATFLKAKEDGKNDRVLFFYTPEEAMEDVDAEAMEALGSDYDMAGNQVVHTVWIERPSDWNKVRTHLEVAGVPEEAGKADAGGLQNALKEFRNSEVIAYLTSRTFTTAAGEVVEENVAGQFTKVA